MANERDAPSRPRDLDGDAIAGWGVFASAMSTGLLAGVGTRWPDCALVGGLGLSVTVALWTADRWRRASMSSPSEAKHRSRRGTSTVQIDSDA